VIRTLYKYLRFAGLVWKYGSLKPHAVDINQARRESIHELREFVPAVYFNSESRFSKKSLFQNFAGQLAFIKNSFKIKCGHLSAGNLSYVRMSKAANTSLSMEMLEKIYPTLKQRTITETQINFLADANVDIRTVAEPIFTVVRNPFSRIVSVYRDFFENKEGDFIYEDYLWGILPRSISFEEFIDRISFIPDRLKDQHFKPQHLVLDYYHRRKITVAVFKLENPEPLRQFLSEHSMQFPHLNKSKQAYDYRSYYTVSLVAKVQALYAADISQFGYENAHKELLKHVETVH
jgi:hypothetical protein